MFKACGTSGLAYSQFSKGATISLPPILIISKYFLKKKLLNNLYI
jgi:hypothetical protein